MDTSDYPSLPNLSQIHARLAANSRRVEAVVDSQLGGIDRLLSATIAEDWEVVAQATRYLAAQSPDDVGNDVVREARYVFEELSQAPHRSNPPKHLASLLAACRSVRTRFLDR